MKSSSHLMKWKTQSQSGLHREHPKEILRRVDKTQAVPNTLTLHSLIKKKKTVVLPHFCMGGTCWTTTPLRLVSQMFINISLSAVKTTHFPWLDHTLNTLLRNAEVCSQHVCTSLHQNQQHKHFRITLCKAYSVLQLTTQHYFPCCWRRQHVGKVVDSTLK